MNSLVKNLLVSPFDRAARAALTRIDTSNPEHVAVVERLRQQHKELFLGRITREDGSYKVQSITHELQAGLAFYRSRLVTIWKYGKDEADEAFYFPEKAPLDWLWLIDQFIGLQEIMLNPKAYKITIDLFPEGTFEELLCSLFAKTSQSIAYKQVAQDKELIIDVATKLEIAIKEVARMITRRRWDLWIQPPFKENLWEIDDYRSHLKEQKAKFKIAGLPLELSLSISIDKDKYLKHLSNSIKASKVIRKSLLQKIKNGVSAGSIVCTNKEKDSLRQLSALSPAVEISPNSPPTNSINNGEDNKHSSSPDDKKPYLFIPPAMQTRLYKTLSPFIPEDQHEDLEALLLNGRGERKIWVKRKACSLGHIFAQANKKSNDSIDETQERLAEWVVAYFNFGKKGERPPAEKTIENAIRGNPAVSKENQLILMK